MAFDQEVQIDCFRQWNQCVEATAEVYMEHPHITTAYLDVIQWDHNGLIAVSDSGICMTNKIIVTFADKSITAMDAWSKPPFPLTT